MRSSSVTELIKHEDGVVSGILLGHNFCSEHEWGIKGLRQLGGGLIESEADAKRVADFSRIVVKIPAECIHFHEAKDLVVLGIEDNGYFRSCVQNWTDKDYKDRKCTRKMSFAEIWARCAYDLGIPTKAKKDGRFPPAPTNSAWCEDAFGIASRDPEVMAFLKDLHQAMLDGDIVLHISSTNNPFKPVSGLVAAINSKIPQQMKDDFKTAHEERFRLFDASDATGILEKLKKSERRYYACSPRWCNENEKPRTKHDVIYWLNPCEQHLVNHGWFTVEELEQWTKGEGPIPKTAAEVGK